MPVTDRARRSSLGQRALVTATLACWALLAAVPPAVWADETRPQSAGDAAPPAAEVILSGPDLLITAGLDGGDVQLCLRTDGKMLYLNDEAGQALSSRVPGTLGAGSPFLAIPLTSFEGAVIVSTQAGDDLLTVDLSWGDFTRPIHYHGGGQRSDPTGVGDALAFVSQLPKQSASLEFFNAHDGTVAFDGNAQVWYTGLEPITSTITVADVTLNYAVASETITVANATTAGQTMVDSTNGEIFTFNNPTNSLTINAGDTGDDRIEVMGVDSAWVAAINLFGQGGTDTVAFLGALDTGGGDLTVLSESLELSATITASGATVDLQQESGDLSLGSSISAGTALLTADAGSILDGTGAEATLITADSTALRATTGIGDASVDASDIDIDAVHLAATTSTGDISISDAAALTINTVDGLVGVAITTGGAGDDILIREGATSGTDDIDVDQVVSNAGDGNITLAADGNTTSDDIEIRAAITATGGSIYLYSYDDVDGVGTVTVSADDVIEVYCGEVFVFGGTPTAGNAGGSFEDATLFQLVTSNDSIKVSAADNITLDAVNAASGGAEVILTADSDGNGSGAIVDGLASEDANITASNVALRAAEGIGATPDLDLDVSGSVAASNSTSGDIILDNASGSNLDIGSVAGLVGVTNPGGGVTIRNASPLTVTENVSALGLVILIATDSASSGDDLTVETGVTVESTGDDVDLRAGDDLLLVAGSTVAGQDLLVAVDFGDADSGTGASAQFLGTLTFTGSGTIDGEADADVFSFDPVASSGTGYSFDGAGGDDVYTVQLGALGAPLSMDDQSSEGSDTLYVQGTSSADDLTITDTGVSGGGESIGYGANLEHLDIDSLAGDDDFDVSPSTTASYALFGGDPTTPPGDQLVFQVPGGQTSTFTPSGTDGGTIATTGGYQDVVIDEFESILDFGDAPSPYPVTLSENGARHFGDGTIRLGSNFDIELFAGHSDSANFDDLDNVDDEDGLVFNVPTLIAGAGGVVVVEASTACLLDAWIDFNGDGSWGGAGEQIFTSQSLSAGSDSLIFAIPVGLTPGLSFARFRVSSAGGLSPLGLAADGEVEDFPTQLDVDTDRDGLGDALEAILLTDPNKQDSDGDGIDDGVEVVIGTDPLSSGDPADRTDSDSDGIPDAFDSAPNNPDANGDGIYDGFALALNQDGSIDGPFTYADPNLDGVLDFEDVQLIYMIARTGMLGGVFPYDIDLDRDGMITPADAMVLLYYLRGQAGGVPLSP